MCGTVLSCRSLLAVDELTAKRVDPMPEQNYQSAFIFAGLSASFGQSTVPLQLLLSASTQAPSIVP